MSIKVKESNYYSGVAFRCRSKLEVECIVMCANLSECDAVFTELMGEKRKLDRKGVKRAIIVAEDAFGGARK